MRGLLFILAALAALTLTLVSCNKEPINDKPISDGDAWEVVLNVPQVKGLDSFNFTMGSFENYEVTAVLKKNGTAVNDADFVWSIGSGYFSTSASREKNYITANYGGSGKSITVDGYYDGVWRASKTLPVTVTAPSNFGYLTSPAGSKGPHGGDIIQFKIKNYSSYTNTARFQLTHRYNHESATTTGNRSVTLGAGESQVFASIELGGDSYISFSGDINGNGGDGGPNPS